MMRGGEGMRKRVGVGSIRSGWRTGGGEGISKEKIVQEEEGRPTMVLTVMG